MTLVTLVTGDSAGARETAIAAAIDSTLRTALILEGLAGGITPLAALPDNDPRLAIFRIAPGCVCCIGNLTMRVTLNRILRRPPEQLFISLADRTHLEQVRAFLTREPYDKLLTLIKEIDLDCRSHT